MTIKDITKTHGYKMPSTAVWDSRHRRMLLQESVNCQGTKRLHNIEDDGLKSRPQRRLLQESDHMHMYIHIHYA